MNNLTASTVVSAVQQNEAFILRNESREHKKPIRTRTKPKSLNLQVQMLYGRQTGEKDAVPTGIGNFPRVCGRVLKPSVRAGF